MTSKPIGIRNQLEYETIEPNRLYMPALPLVIVQNLRDKRRANAMQHKEEEAAKTMEQAEELFKAHDYRGALMLAHKARCLFSSLPGLVNVLIAYHIHVCARARKTPSGDTDWHAVLSAPPSSDATVIKKQYMNMRHLTHPENCKSAAAKGAFQLVERAWSCLNSSSPPPAGSTTSSEPQNTTSRPRSPQPPTRTGDAKVKPAIRNNSKCQSAMITPENQFTESSSRRQPENGLPPPRHTPTSPSSPSRAGSSAQATSFTMHSSSQSSIPKFLLCPFCGTQNCYRVIDGLCHITCKQCGVTSSIRREGASLNRSDQVSGASPPSSQTGIAVCRKCRIPYDGKIPNNRRILRKCKLCGSWASIKLEIKQIRIHEDQTTSVVPGSGDEPSEAWFVAPAW
ncbi:uncharacterized protein [Elaeis guineensis]|uniref:Uncharacterized protein LOC109505075 n=1 Tax=Elaeis guineensis var. tenera TaxID=51953 RepID=A0A6J0PCA9_ELAGV|nr:uncharacterized protein LOC109505075 [Elaeis guineensis]